MEIKTLKIKFKNTDTETIQLGKKWLKYSLTEAVLVLYGKDKIRNIPLHNIEEFIAEEK